MGGRILSPLPRDFGSYDLLDGYQEQCGTQVILRFPHSHIFLSQLPPCRFIETLSELASLQVNTAALSAQAARSFQAWDGTRPPSVGGTLLHSHFPPVCRYPDDRMDARGHLRCDRSPNTHLCQQTVGLEQCGRTCVRGIFSCVGNGEVARTAGG